MFVVVHFVLTQALGHHCKAYFAVADVHKVLHGLEGQKLVEVVLCIAVVDGAVCNVPCAFAVHPVRRGNAAGEVDNQLVVAYFVVECGLDA